MPLKNSETSYGSITKSFHWGMAALVICLLAIGLLMGELPKGTLKLTTYNLHKSLGITVLALTFCRLCWHFYGGKPLPVETLKAWEKHLSKVLHLSLYTLLIAMPLSGWAMSSAAGRSVGVFGLFTLPDFITPNEDTAKTLKELHETIGTLIMITLGLHIAAALKHHFMDKDVVLKRMLSMIAFLICLLPPAASAGDVRKWNVLQEQSSITFRPKQMGKEFKGTFDLFSAEIAFDPDKLSSSKVVVSIDISNTHTQDADRDVTLKGKDWFDVIQFPTAKFETTDFCKTGDNAYEAGGILTIRNVSEAMALPFTLNITKNPANGDKAVVDGSIIVDRSKFQLGTGEWADTSVIANEVPVDIHIVAVDANPPPVPAK